MKFWSSCTLVLVFTLTTLFISGCGRGNKGDELSTLRIGSGAEPRTIDPQLLTDVTGHKIAMALFEGLVTPHPRTMEPEPGVAESWELSDDKLTYTFKLREDARWSNGDPVTSSDFLFSFKRILTPALGSMYAYMFYPVRNAEAYFTGRIQDFEEVGFSAPDDHTLVVKLSAPTPYFLSLICHSSWYPVHPPTIKQHNAKASGTTQWTRPGNLVGNGPFTLTEWRPQQRLAVAPNPHYWDAETVQLDRIEFHTIADITAQERAFRAGQIDITEALPLTRVPYYKDSLSPDLRIDPYLGTYYYLLNVTRAPLNDVKVRRALSLAIDRQAIINGVAHGVYEKAGSFVPPAVREWTIENAPVFNPEKARELLSEAGFPNGEGFPTVELTYNTSENHRAIAEVVQQMWRENLGINITLANQEWRAMLETRERGNFQIMRAGWIGDYYDPRTFLEVYTSYSGNNHSGWRNSEYDQQIAQGNNSTDNDQRLRHFQRADQILTDEAPLIPVYYYQTIYLASPKVKGWYPTLLDVHPYKYVSIER